MGKGDNLKPAVQKRKSIVRGPRIYEGKAKILYTTQNPGRLIQEFKDSVTAFDATKKTVMKGKGALNCAISTRIFQGLKKEGVSTHFIRQLSETEMLVHRLQMFPLEVVLRNRMAGSFARRMGKEEGETLPSPVIEFYLKDDSLHDPWLNDDHILALGLATSADIRKMKRITHKVNHILTRLFDRRGLILADFKLEFGKDAKGRIRLGDEFTPDSSRLWDAHTFQKLDKDVFRRDLGDLLGAYREVLSRLSS